MLYSCFCSCCSVNNDTYTQFWIGKCIFNTLTNPLASWTNQPQIYKFDYYGVKGSANKLLQSYLSERLQYIEFEMQILDKLPITTSLLQGSILRPLLVLFYINDLPSVCNLFNMIMYADDTTLYCKKIETATDVDDLLKAKKLSLNVAKTKCMVFHT